MYSNPNPTIWRLSVVFFTLFISLKTLSGAMQILAPKISEIGRDVTITIDDVKSTDGLKLQITSRNSGTTVHDITWTDGKGEVVLKDLAVGVYMPCVTDANNKVIRGGTAFEVRP